MKKGFTALQNETWEEYKEPFRKKMKASEWAFDRIKEAFDLVAQDEARKVSVVQEIMFKSTDYLWRIIASVGGQVVSQCLTCARTATVSLWKTTFGGSLLGRSTPAGGVRFVKKVRFEATEQASGRANWGKF